MAKCLYRLPYSKEVTTVTSDACELLHSIEELRGRSGFVMVPFNINGKHPIILLPDSKVSVSPYIDSEVKNSQSRLKENNERKCITSDITDSYAKAFNAFSKALHGGEFKKLVLSRKLESEWKGNEDDIIRAFHAACARYPRMMIWTFIKDDGNAWIGCTPEILIDGEKSHYRTVALAGTMRADEIHTQWSEKNREEQRIVANYIRQRITPLCEVVEEEGPFTSHAGHLIHLKTEFHFTPCATTTVIDLVKTLHPTPAVCGMPMEEALDFIVHNEGYDRSYYSGIVGWIDQNAATHLYVNLRCARIANNMMTLFAGGGILAESEIQSEWNETEDKIKTTQTLFN